MSAVPVLAELPTGSSVPWVDASVAAQLPSLGLFGGVVHAGWPSGATDAGHCGAPFSWEGAIMDAVPMPQLA